jgi:hypothetical protein
MALPLVCTCSQVLNFPNIAENGCNAREEVQGWKEGKKPAAYSLSLAAAFRILMP